VGLAAVVLALVAVAAADPPADGDQQSEVAFAPRYTADLHGTVTRIGNSVVTCNEAMDAYRVDNAAPCADARRGVGGGIYNNNYQMKHLPSTGADLTLPAGSKVAYARLYWGGTYGMDSPNAPKKLTSGQIANISLRAPGDLDYRAVTADPGAAVGRMKGEVEYGYQTSADVTGIVAAAGSGTYGVKDLGVVTTPYSWGGWTLVVAYENTAEPLRRIRLWDGYRVVAAETPPVALDLTDLSANSENWPDVTLGYIAYDGDRTRTGDRAEIVSRHGFPLPLGDAASPYDDIMNSTANGFHRDPDHVNTFGWDADQYHLPAAVWPGDTGLSLTFSTDDDGYQVGAVWAAVDLETTTP
jgi:hypothetical protein